MTTPTTAHNQSAGLDITRSDTTATSSSTTLNITTTTTTISDEISNIDTASGPTSQEDIDTAHIYNNTDTDVNNQDDHVVETENRSKLFSDVKFFISAQSDNFDDVKKVLIDGGGTLINYLSDIVTHVIADHNSSEDKLVEEAVDIFEKPVVRSKWVWMSLKTNRKLPPCAFSPLKPIFASVVACFAENVSQNDTKKLSAILTYYGGYVQKEFNLHQADCPCTHLIAAKADGDIFKQAIKSELRRFRIVTPDWIVDSSKTKTLCDEEIYDPILLEFPLPPKPQPAPPPTQIQPQRSNQQQSQQNQQQQLPTNQTNHTNAISLQPRQNNPTNQKHPPVVHFQNRNPSSTAEQRAQMVSMNNNRPQVYYQQQSHAQTRHAQAQAIRQQFRSENPISAPSNHDLMSTGMPHQNLPQEQSANIVGQHNNMHPSQASINNLLDQTHVQQSHIDSNPQQQQKMRMIQPIRSHLNQQEYKPGFGPAVTIRQNSPHGVVTMSPTIQPIQRVTIQRPIVNDSHVVRQVTPNNYDGWRRAGPDQMVEQQQKVTHQQNVRTRQPQQFGGPVILNNQQIRQVNQQQQSHHPVQIVSGISRIHGPNQQIVHLQHRNQYHLSNSHPQNPQMMQVQGAQMNRPQVYFQQPQQQAPNNQIRMQQNQINIGRPMHDQSMTTSARMMGVDSVHIQQQQMQLNHSQATPNLLPNHQHIQAPGHQKQQLRVSRGPNPNLVEFRQINRHPSTSNVAAPLHGNSIQMQQNNTMQQQHPSIFNNVQGSLAIRPNLSSVPKKEQIAAYIGHETPEALPATHQLLGCTFVFSEHENTSKDCLDHWFAIIKQNGGKITELLSECTHLICETRSTDIYRQALLEGKRCVTIYWVNDVIAQRRLDPPWKAIHIPLPYTKDNLPCTDHIISITNFEGKERADLREMILRCGARYTDYLSPKNTILVCRTIGGQKYKKALHWKISIVNAQWLTDVLLGSVDQSSLVSSRYQFFKNDKPLRISSYNSIQDVMSPWLHPIQVLKEEIDGVSKLPCIKLETGQGSKMNLSEDNPLTRINGTLKQGSEDGDHETQNFVSNVSNNQQNLIKSESEAKTEDNGKQGSESSSNPPADQCNNSNSSASNLASTSSTTNHTNTTPIQQLMIPTPKSPFNKQQNNISITFTQIGTSRLEDLKNQAIKLGAKVVEDPVKCTHLIADRVCRTTTFICAFNYAKYILKTNWLTESYRASTLLDEKDFLLHDRENEDKFCFSMRQSLRRRARREAHHLLRMKQDHSTGSGEIVDIEDSSRKCLLFKDLVFFVTPGVKPAPAILKPMIESAGGQVVFKKPPNKIQYEQMRSAGKQLVAISCENDYHLCEDLVSYGARIEQTEFVMSGILRQEIDYDSFKLTNNSTIPPELNNMITIRPPPTQPHAHKRMRLEESTSC